MSDEMTIEEAAWYVVMNVLTSWVKEVKEEDAVS